MNTLEILFFVLLFIVFYTYVGYGILLWILVKIKQSFISFYDTDEPEQETCRNGNNTDLPEITLFITAYNEEQVVDGKMKNCQELDYPKEKLHIVWVTDGSNDRTNEKLKAYPDVTLSVSYTHLRAHETGRNLVCRLLLEKKKIGMI